MTPEEYIQLKAFARIDGFLLSLLWVSSFVCYIVGISNPVWSLGAIVLALASPIFVGKRLQQFRDNAREGIISFKRGWGYVTLVFFYAAVILALVQYAYFTYLDNGYLFQAMNSMMDTAEGKQLIAQYNMGETMTKAIDQFRSMRPIDMSLNVLTTNIMIGTILAVPIAALLKSNVKRINKDIQS